MFSTFVALAGTGILLLFSEYLWRRKLIAGEYGRKLVHMSVGIYIASWPFFISMYTIQLIALAAVVAIAVSRRYKVFHAIHDVKRRTAGEVVYPFGVLLAAILAHANWIFSVAILFVALADGMAAVIGKKYGTKKLTYHVFGAKKTFVGSFAYIIFAYVAIIVGYFIGGRETIQHSPFVVLIWLPFFTTMLEAISIYGTDNITAPLAVVLLLNMVLLPI